MYGCWVVLLFNVHTDNNALHIRVYNSVVLYYNTAWMQVAENSKDDKVCTTRLWRQVSQLSALSARSIFVVNIISSYHLDWSLPELRRVELTLTYYYSCAQGGGWDWCLLLWGRGQEAVVWHIISAEGTTLNTAFKLVLGGSTHTRRPNCESMLGSPFQSGPPCLIYHHSLSFHITWKIYFMCPGYYGSVDLFWYFEVYILN